MPKRQHRPVFRQERLLRGRLKQGTYRRTRLLTPIGGPVPVHGVWSRSLRSYLLIAAGNNEHGCRARRQPKMLAFKSSGGSTLRPVQKRTHQ
jgi:hypothetical protein